MPVFREDGRLLPQRPSSPFLEQPEGLIGLQEEAEQREGRVKRFLGVDVQKIASWGPSSSLGANVISTQLEGRFMRHLVENCRGVAAWLSASRSLRAASFF